MSMELMVKAMKIRVGNPLRKLVLIKLADNASDKGECWPSYQHIADQCEISKRSVMNHIAALCESGLVKKVTRKGEKGNSSNIYLLHLDGAGDSLGGSANDSLSGAANSPGSAGVALGGSAGDSPRTSHSFEPVKEPVNEPIAVGERLESMATDNCARWVLSVVRRDLGFDDSHVVTMPELCWWLIRNDLADALPESAARKALRLPKPVVPSVTRESDLVPSVPATSIIQDKAKKVLALKVDPESPESFMLRPKRRRWVNEKYTRWVKTQPCACCGKPADDPHHLIGHGQCGMGTKAHDLFVLPLCRKHHDELHADTVAFEERYGSQLELIFRFIDRALAIGVLA